MYKKLSPFSFFPHYASVNLVHILLQLRAFHAHTNHKNSKKSHFTL